MTDTPDDFFTQYNFLNESENKILQPDALMHFFVGLQRLENNQSNQVHILHIGDSHIQADFFSGKMRDLYAEDERFPVNSRGFAFPYKLAKSNNPTNYGVSYTGSWEGKRSVKSKQFSRWGLAGVVASTFSPSATFIINPNREGNVAHYSIQRVKIFYPSFDSRSFVPEVDLVGDNSLTSTVVGDGYIEYTFLKPQNSVSVRFKKENERQNQFVLQGISLENDQPGLTYSASGANGAEVPTYFRCEDFRKNLAQLNPQLVIISLGTNDAHTTSFSANRFKADYEKLIAQVRSVLPKASILLTTVGDSYRNRKYLNQNNALANEQILALGKEKKLAVWNVYPVMGGFKSIDAWRANGLSSFDRLHLSQKGYELQGELLYQALDRAYTEWAQGRAK